jgi:hypothetical protein
MNRLCGRYFVETTISGRLGRRRRDFRVWPLCKAGSGKSTKVESITKQGKLVAFEAQVRTDGKCSEVQVGPDGNLNLDGRAIRGNGLRCRNLPGRLAQRAEEDGCMAALI